MVNVQLGGIRFDVDIDYHVTPGENRPVRFNVLDEDGNPVLSFAGWEFEWFVCRSENSANGLDQLRARSIVYKEDADIDAGTVPFVDLELLPTDLVQSGNYWHELWRVDTDNHRRLSYGDFVVIG